jgi:two-component system, sensor histidine kinase and response regulator
MSEFSLPRILIVDDEVMHMKALCNTLKDHEYETVGVSSAQAALATLHKMEFDLLLTDLMMPEMNGIELLHEAFKINPNLIGIIMTGEGTIPTAVEAMKTGALDYILKPFKLSVILPVLARALSVRRLRLENAALEKRVQERTVQLEAANQELDAFAFSVSHDLRTPLRHIMGFAGLLEQDEPSLSENAKRHLATITRSARQMEKLISDLLDFSRTSRAAIRRTEVNLDELMQKAIRDAQPEIASRNIVWKTNLLPRVQADPALLQQVLSNLILNAIKYSRTRNPAEIETGSMTAGATGETIIFIRDNGVGFDMKYADKLFGVFQRLHRQDEFEGTGIGLANVRRIITRHGGRTWAEGKVDAGATFYFTLPGEPVFPPAKSDATRADGL